MMLPGILSAILAGGGSGFEIEYLGAINFSGTQINGSIDIGPAHPSKEIFVLCSVTFGGRGGLLFTGGTVDGQAVTPFTSQFTSSDDRQVGAFVGLPTQFGSVVVDMNFDDTLGSGAAFVHKVLNRPGIGTNQTDASGVQGAGVSLTLNATTISQGGIWFATGIENIQNAVSWNNGDVDEEFDTSLGNAAWSAHRGPQSLITPTDIFSWGASHLYSGASWAFT